MQRAEAAIRAAREQLGANRLAELDAHAAADPLGHRERLRQAHLRLRVPGHQSRRPGHHQHRDQQAQRPGGRGLPGRRRRPGHAGDRPRPGDPHPGRRHPHRGRNTQGVRLFDVADDEHVVSVARLVGAAEPNEPEPNGPGPDEPGSDPNEPEPNGPGLNGRGPKRTRRRWRAKRTLRWRSKRTRAERTRRRRSKRTRELRRPRANAGWRRSCLTTRISGAARAPGSIPGRSIRSTTGISTSCRATMSDVAEDEHVVAVVRLVGVAQPNEPEPYRLNEPGGGDPNEPESCDGIGPMLDGADRG